MGKMSVDICIKSVLRLGIMTSLTLSDLPDSDKLRLFVMVAISVGD